METITYKLEHFEGPLDLLLHLIEKNKIDIYDIPIADITAQYLDYVRQMEEAEATLRAIRARFDAIRQGEVPGGRDWDSIFRFQGYTIDYGIAAARFEWDWYARLLCELEEKE